MDELYFKYKQNMDAKQEKLIQSYKSKLIASDQMTSFLDDAIYILRVSRRTLNNFIIYNYFMTSKKSYKYIIENNQKDLSEAVAKLKMLFEDPITNENIDLIRPTIINAIYSCHQYRNCLIENLEEGYKNSRLSAHKHLIN